MCPAVGASFFLFFAFKEFCAFYLQNLHTHTTGYTRAKHHAHSLSTFHTDTRQHTHITPLSHTLTYTTNAHTHIPLRHADPSNQTAHAAPPPEPLRAHPPRGAQQAEQACHQGEGNRSKRKQGGNRNRGSRPSYDVRRIQNLQNLHTHTRLHTS